MNRIQFRNLPFYHDLCRRGHRLRRQRQASLIDPALLRSQRRDIDSGSNGGVGVTIHVDITSVDGRQAEHLALSLDKGLLQQQGFTVIRGRGRRNHFGFGHNDHFFDLGHLESRNNHPVGYRCGN